MTRHAQLISSLGVVAAAAGWGLFWIPLRALDENGVEGAWSTLALFSIGTLALLPIAVVRTGTLGRLNLSFVLTGLCSGGAWILYTNSLLLTDVVRSLLLFYLSPVWSTLILWAMYRDRVAPVRLLTIAMGLGGLMTILGFGEGLPLPRNLGDWMGLVSGLIWAVASVRLRGAPAAGTFAGVFGFFACGSVLAGVSVLLPIEALGATPSWDAILDRLSVMVVLSVGFIVPSMLLIVSGARRIDPARVGILLMAEAVVGTISAAILTNEPFGAREVIGAILILAAGVVDVLGAEPTGTERDSTSRPA
ncbi:MAG: DMT family transporter [Alphaproteobacteria bacterium]|nr:DMT family transporter [Alphaproteobacteria bacterium]